MFADSIMEVLEQKFEIRLEDIEVLWQTHQASTNAVAVCLDVEFSVGPTGVWTVLSAPLIEETKQKLVKLLKTTNCLPPRITCAVWMKPIYDGNYGDVTRPDTIERAPAQHLRV
jgi:hypothetical protein